MFFEGRSPYTSTKSNYCSRRKVVLDQYHCTVTCKINDLLNMCCHPAHQEVVVTPIYGAAFFLFFF